MSLPVYGAVSLCTLIGRGWNLFKYNLKPSLLLMLVPTITYTFVSVLASIPGTYQTLAASSVGPMMISFLSVAAAILLAILAWFISMYACTALTRIYYSALVQEQPMGVKESLSFLKNKCGALFVMFLTIGLACLVFSVLDVVGFVLGFFATAGLVSAFVAVSAPFLQAGAIILAILVGFLTLAGLFLLLTYQIFFCLFPLVAVATSSEGEKILQAGGHSLKVLLANSKRAAVFGTLLLSLYFILALILQLPSILWLLMELQRLAVQQELPTPGSIPLHVSVLSHVWSSMTNTVVWGFMFAATTLFWYDCQVRAEGLDIRLALQRLGERRRKSIRGIQT